MHVIMKFANSEKILSQSKGAVTDPNTVDLKTFEPIPNGLHCQKIFGPIDDFSCACPPPEGLHDKRHRDKVCEKCGVKIDKSEMRRHRWGHFEMPFPVVNPLAISILADVLKVSYTAMPDLLGAKLFFGWEKKSRGTHFVHLPEGLCRASLTVDTQRNPTGNVRYRAPRSLYNAVMAIDVEQTIAKSSSKRVQEILIHLKRYGTELDHLFISVLPIIPAGLRPIRNVKGKKSQGIANDPRNAYYSRIVWKCLRWERIRKFLDVQLILEREEGLIQEAVNDLFFGGKELRGKVLDGLVKYISGKTGILRKNLLGKRVDFSGRSIITPNPHLSLDEVGLPYKMAYSLFTPFILQALMEEGLTYRRAARWYEEKHSRCWQILEKIAPGERLILNRQPTLHRIGMMSFKIRLHPGKSIQLSPMVCTPFNADFDGDQMAVHLPLYDNTREEVAELMSPEKNLLGPLNSELAMSPSHEMIIGAFFMTFIRESNKVQRFRSKELAMVLFEQGVITISEKIFVNGLETCIGRLLFEDIFKLPVTEAFNKKNLRQYLGEAYNFLPLEKFVAALKTFQRLAFEYATKAGFSLGMEDFVQPSTKTQAYIKANQFERTQNEKAKEGLITEDERYKSIVQCWKNTFDGQDALWQKESDPDNPVAIMYRTGSRVSLSQISQLVVAKGLQADASGFIYETPVQPCLRGGLDTFSFFRSCTGARKAMYDKKNATPRSGYLARRLVTVARDFYIAEEDCGYSGQGVLIPRNQAHGRTLLSGELITEKIDDPTFVSIRSPVFCQTSRGLCSKCYGLDPVTRETVKVGAAVGVIAAQSLTEPTTQMTMRTFHTSGAVELGKSSLAVLSATAGQIRLEEGKNLTEIWVDDKKYLVKNDLCTLLVNDGDQVGYKTPLAVYTNTDLRNQDISGALEVIERYYEMTDPPTTQAIIALRSGVVRLQVTQDGDIAILVNGEQQGVSTSTPIFVYDGEVVSKGQFLTSGEINPRKIDSDDLSLKATVFINRLLQVYKQEGVSSWSIHLEVIFRALSEFIETDEGYGLYRYGAKGERLVKGANDVGKEYPSWLKILCFGYTKLTLTRTALSPRWTYDLPSERLLIGQMPLFDRPK